MASFVEPPGRGRGLHLGLEVVTLVWTYARQAVPFGLLSVCILVSTESRWCGSGVAGTLRPSPAAPASVARPPPTGLYFLQFSFSQQTLAGNVCADDAKFRG